MKNRTHELPYKNGKFFCRHKWEVDEDVGPNWDVALLAKISCKCEKCGKVKRRRSSLIAEVPDHRIKRDIIYI